MEEKVSTTVEKNSRCEQELMTKMEQVAEQIDVLREATANFGELKTLTKKKKRAAQKGVDEMIEKVVDCSEDYVKLGPFADKLFADKLARLHKKINYKPNKKVENFGFKCYEDMLLCYRDLKKNLEMMKKLNERMTGAMTDLGQEHRNMCQIAEKVDELRFRSNLLTVCNVISSRVEPNDPTAGFCVLPGILCGIIFLPETSNYYAFILLRLCKRLLVVAEALQYEKSPTNEPIVTNSNILSHPTTKPPVPSLYVPVADCNGETAAPVDNPAPVARDSAHCLPVTENGEVFAPSTSCLPVAKDSAMTLVAKDSPQPMSGSSTSPGQMTAKGNSEKSKISQK